MCIKLLALGPANGAILSTQSKSGATRDYSTCSDFSELIKSNGFVKTVSLIDWNKTTFIFG